MNNANALSAEGDALEASPAMFLFQEITPETLPSFHLHGDDDDWPLSAILVFPSNTRSHDQLLGDYALSETLRAVRPVEVVRTILGIVLRLQELMSAYIGLVAASTTGFVVLILLISRRLRADELTLLRRIGASRATVSGLLATELLLVGVSAAVTAAAMIWTALWGLDTWFGP